MLQTFLRLLLQCSGIFVVFCHMQESQKLLKTCLLVANITKRLPTSRLIYVRSLPGKSDIICIVSGSQHLENRLALRGLNIKCYNSCVFKRRAIFKKKISMAASASKYLWLRILESSTNSSKILAVMRQCTKMFVIKHFLRQVQTLKIY